MTRPQDYGGQYPGDIDDPTVADPTDGLEEFDGRIFDLDIKSIYGKECDAEDTPEIQERKPDRHAWHGVVNKEVTSGSTGTNNPRVYEVYLQNGRIVNAYLMSQMDDEEVRIMDPCIVVRGNVVDEYYMLAQRFKAGGGEGGKPVYRAKAYADWQSGPYVDCQECDAKGVVTKTDIIRINIIPSRPGDPYVFANSIVLWTYDVHDQRVCVSDVMGPKIGSVKPFTGYENTIEEGWHICDGAGGTKDLRHRFIMCRDSNTGARDDEKTAGTTGGHRWHGTTENNHDDHANHRHKLDMASVDYFLAMYGLDVELDPPVSGMDVTLTHTGHVKVLEAETDSIAYTLGVENLNGETGNILKHLGPDNTGTNLGDTDNRPLYYVLAIIERVK